MIHTIIPCHRGLYINAVFHFSYARTRGDLLRVLKLSRDMGYATEICPNCGAIVDKENVL